MRFRSVIFVSILVISGALRAQEAQQRWLNEQTNTQVSLPSTGDGDTPGNRDFLSRFIAALQSYSDSGGEAITLDYNLPAGIFTKSLGSKVQVVLKKPALNEKLKTKYKDQSALLTTLESELGYGDDVTVTFAISPLEKKSEKKVEEAIRTAGPWLLADKFIQVAERRGFSPTQDSTRMIRSAFTGQRSDGFALFDAIYRRDANSVATFSRSFNAIATRDASFAPFRTEGEGASGTASTLQLMEMLTDAADETLNDAAAIAANQSKFNFDASYRDRRNTVGADEWFVKATYEYGPGTNVEKRLRRIQRDARSAGLRERDLGCAEVFAAAIEDRVKTEVCADDYAKAVKETADDETVKTGTRLTFSIEYKDQSAINIDSKAPDPVFAFEQKSARSLVGSFVAGRDVFKDAAAKKANDRSGRIELNIAYDDVSGDKDRHDRLIGKLTYSQRISDKLFIPISLVYASHADYLTNVEHKFNAHFGLAYKIPSKATKKAGE